MKQKLFAVLAILGAVLLCSPAFGSSSSHGDSHGSGHTMEHGENGSGKKVHTAQVADFVFEYRLIDMKEKMKGMKNMPKMKETHHLMVYVKDMHGKPIKNAKVGYLIQGPGKSIEKKMAMHMNKGFGADVTFLHGKPYLIKTKAVVGDHTLVDSFDFKLSH